jgi:hypothetical protein
MGHCHFMTEISNNVLIDQISLMNDQLVHQRLELDAANAVNEKLHNTVRELDAIKAKITVIENSTMTAKVRSICRGIRSVAGNQFRATAGSLNTTVGTPIRVAGRRLRAGASRIARVTNLAARNTIRDGLRMTGGVIVKIGHFLDSVGESMERIGNSIDSSTAIVYAANRDAANASGNA